MNADKRGSGMPYSVSDLVYPRSSVAYCRCWDLVFDLIVELFRHFGVDALERFVLRHRLRLVVDRVVSEREVEVSLGQIWPELNHFFIRLDRF